MPLGGGPGWWLGSDATLEETGPGPEQTRVGPDVNQPVLSA